MSRLANPIRCSAFRESGFRLPCAFGLRMPERLKRARRISFEDVVFHIEAGDEVEVFKHPNQLRYPGQKISVVLVEGHAYLAPFVESNSDIFLKTIIPSRKASKQYVGDSDDQA